MNLPIDAVLPELLRALRDHSRALLVAPPGAGKTTKVAPALINEDWCHGEILLLVPRRLAARAAAEFMAGAISRGISEEVANTVFTKIMAFASFGFPKSHAAAMAVLVTRASVSCRS